MNTMQDIHTHLYWQSYDEDRDEVVARARAAGVREMVVVGCTVEESRQAVVLTERYSDMYAAVGIHPHFFNEFVEKEFPISNFQPASPAGGFPIKSQIFNDEIQKLIEELRTLARTEKVVAIGECGLDYYSHVKTVEISEISDEQKRLQKEGFLAQVTLAQELELPVIVHCRDAYEDMFEILKNHSSLIPHSVSCVLHCYMGDTEVTKKFLTLPNVFFSFTGNITYPVKKALVGTRDDICETVKLIPPDRIFAETDCPFLAPQSKRGERNEPQYVTEVYTTIALLQDRTVDQVRGAIEMNRKRVFTRMV